MKNEPIPLLDLAAIHRAQAEEIEAAVLAVLRSGRYVLGPEVEALESELQQWLGSGPVIGLSSGTDAILLALMALDVGAGDEVVTTPFTFFATAGTVARLGAKPVFVDVEPSSLNLDPARLEAALGPRTKAILPVHLFGRPADLGRIGAVAARHGLPVVEDCAQAIGARIAGVSVGTRSAFGTWSFFPSKNLGAAGDAGFLTVGDPERAGRARALRAHGEIERYHHRWVGGNFRIDALQAAILRVKLRRLDEENAARARNAERYGTLFEEAGLLGEVALPTTAAGTTHAWHQYTIETPRRDAVAGFLGKRGIGCGVYYPVPLHLQECFASLGNRSGAFPVAEAAARRVLSLPIHGGLRPEQQQRVVAAVKEALAP